MYWKREINNLRQDSKLKENEMKRSKTDEIEKLKKEIERIKEENSKKKESENGNKNDNGNGNEKIILVAILSFVAAIILQKLI